MPTRKDKTNVAPIYREQVFIPASGATLIKQKARPKIAVRPVSSGAIEIVSPEFDLLTGVRGITNIIRPKSINITTKNAASLTDKQWDKAYNIAINNNNLEEVQRLRDLHFSTKAPNTVIKTVDGNPARVYHGTFNKGWTSYNRKYFGTATDNGMYGEGLYATSSKNYATTYATPYSSNPSMGEVKELYINAEKPFYVYNSKQMTPKNIVQRQNAAYYFGRNFSKPNDVPKDIWDEMKNSDVVIESYRKSRPNFSEIVIPKGEQIKSANAITYDNNGKIIPLSKRDNFNINDIRYGLIPLTGLGALTTTNDKMKCGGRRKAQLGLSVTDGGSLIPIGKNMFLAQGRTHAQGGIGLTFGKNYNPKGDLEIEKDELVQIVGGNNVKFNGNNKFKGGGQEASIRVFSSVPLLRGVSPAELVLQGYNPDVVFKAQEEFKDRNRINDDGTRYETGGLKLFKAAPKQKPTWSDFLYNLMFAGTAFEKSKSNPVTLTNEVADKPVQQQYIAKNDATRIAKPIIQNEVSEDKAKQLLEYYGATPYYPSLEIIDFIKQKEGFKPKIYNDGKGVPTIGYGFTEKTPNGKNILKQWKNKNMTKDEADSIMNEAIGGYLPAFIKATPNFHSLNNNQRDALFSYYYNIGHGNYTRKSPALQEALKNKDYEAVTNNMDFDYNNENFGGARIRRDEERAWFNKKAGGIYIKPIKRGTFTDAAKKRGMGVQEFASKVLANKEDYSSAMVKKANFARNASRWKKEFGGSMIYTINGNVKNGLMSARPKAQYGKQRKVESYGNTIVVGDDTFMLNKDGIYVPVDNVQIKKQPKTVRGASGRRDIAYDRQGNRYQRRSDGSLIRVSPEKGNIAVSDTIRGVEVNAKNLTTQKNRRDIYWASDQDWNRNNDDNYPEGSISEFIKSNTTVPDYAKKANPPRQKVESDFGIGTQTVVNFLRNNNGKYNTQRTSIHSFTPAQKLGLSSYGWSTYDDPNKGYSFREDAAAVKAGQKSVDEIIGQDLSQINFDNNQSNTTPSRGEKKTRTSKPATNSKSSTKGADTKYGTPLAEKKESLYMTGIKNNVVTPIRAGMEKIKSPSSTGDGTQSKDGRWIGQYKPVTTADWIGLGSNLAGTVASYFMTKNAINKMPDPIKPIMAQAAKLKTRYNVEPQLTNVREAEQINRAAVRRNTQSSNTSLTREQRLMNESRDARNVLYGQKENIETQLINQDRMNRQAVAAQNVNTYNDYLTRLYAGKVSQNQLGISNINNFISGLTGSVNNILSTIESRRATNNTLRAIAAANPNVDARLIGGFDYYIDPITKRKYNKNQQYIGTINS